jgi:hypothetical protein
MRPNRVHGALCCFHVPALGIIFACRLSNELADNVGFRGSELLDKVLQLGLWGLIQPQHKALGIGARVMGTLLWSCLLTAGRKIRDGNLAHHVSQPGRELHASRGRRLLHSRMPFRVDEAGEVANRALWLTLVKQSYLPTAKPPLHDTVFIGMGTLLFGV